MIRLNAADGDILLASLERDRMDAIAELYNNSGDIRYATGFSSPVSNIELFEKMDKLETNENEFLAGIFITNSNHDTGDCQSQFTGAVSGVLHDKILWIKLMAILPQFRNKGIGSRTARLLLQYNIECYSVTDAFLTVFEKNVPGMHFWSNQGFKEAGRIHKVLFSNDQSFEVIIMHKKLS
jgi:GNAT superfamily N-acetyltransferase